MAKRKQPKYVKILQGMNCCYGSDDRNCADCPYDKYNERDFYGQGTSYCMEKLNSDAMKWTQSMEMFSYCADCCCWHKDKDEDGFVHYDWEGEKGFCGVWNTIMYKEDFCSRGGRTE